MKTQTRQYYVASGSVYAQVRHYDDDGDFVGEQWEKKTDHTVSAIGFAAYVSPAMCTRIANNYIKYQQFGKYDKLMLRKIIALGKHEHYTGNEGRIIYIAHATTIFTSTKVIRIAPPFDAAMGGDTSMLMPAADTAIQLTLMPPQR
jgi:hypothetical protein